MDHATLAVRADAPVATLRFFSAISEGQLTEACRIQTSVQHLKSIADLICRTLEHTPPKPD